MTCESCSIWHGQVASVINRLAVGVEKIASYNGMGGYAVTFLRIRNGVALYHRWNEIISLKLNPTLGYSSQPPQRIFSLCQTALPPRKEPKHP